MGTKNYDTDKKLECKKIYADLFEICSQFRYGIRHPKYKEILLRFQGVLKFSEQVSLADRLPYYSETPRAKNGVREECVFAELSYIIQFYHQFEAGLLKEPFIEEMYMRLACIKRIAQEGLAKYRVTGTAEAGYTLVIKDTP